MERPHEMTSGGAMGRLIEIVPGSQLRRRRREVLDAGRVVVDGFSLPDDVWPVIDEVTCVGTVATQEQMVAALLATVRGASLLIDLQLTGPERQRLISDLSNLAPIVFGPPGSARRTASSLTREEEILVDQLAVGASVAEAAGHAGLSLRSGHRRLAALRERLGVSTNAQVVVRVAGSRADDAAPTDADADHFFVARARELAAIAEPLSACRAVALLGEAGIGKSTLLHVAGAAFGTRVVEGGALATMQWMPYLPIIRAIGPLPDGADAAAVAHHLMEAVGDDLLVLDDLQWADAATLALLPYIADHLHLLVAIRTGDPGTAAASEAVSAIGGVLIELDGLPDDLAADLVRSRHPVLSDRELEAVVERAGGNPLLLDELAGDASPTLVASLLARLDTLGNDARLALARLALLGRPADPHLLGEGLPGLVNAGLVRVSDGRVHLRHDLIGSAVLELVDGAERRRLHAELAERVPLAESARHHFAAGHLTQARAAALASGEQAAFPAQRASDLLLAAACTAAGSGRRDLEVSLRAIDALLEAGDLDEARRTLDDLGAAPDTLIPEISLRRARLCWQAGDPEGCRRAAEEGLAIAAGSRTPVEVRLRVEQLRHPIRVEFDAVRAVEMARQTWDLSRAVGVEEPRARALFGSALLVAGSNDWTEHLPAAVAQARVEGDLDVALEASNALVAAHMLGGDRAVARAQAREAASVSHTAHRRAWEEQFSIIEHLLALLAGECHDVATWAREFVGPRLTVAVHTAYAIHALALADLGHGRDALGVLAEGSGLGRGDATGASLLRWAEAETQWLTGHPDRAVTAADLCLAEGAANFPVRPLAGALRAYAELDLGVTPRPVEPSSWSFAHAAACEGRGVSQMSAGEHAAAIECFDEAAALAADVPRFELRARWGAGEARRRAGDLDGARQVLVGVVAEATRRGFAPLAGRARRSLRLTGLDPEPGTTRADALTPRQHEVLVLVAEGHSSAEIGSVLGLRPSTVDSHIRTAMQRLGATTRRQAAVLTVEHDLANEGAARA